MKLEHDSPRRGSLATVLFLLPSAHLAVCPSPAASQFPTRETIGQFYRVEAPAFANHLFDALRIERVAPHALSLPAPISPLTAGTSLQALNGAIVEFPSRGVLYLSARDGRGIARVLEIDLLRRQIRQVRPPPGSSPPYASEFLVAADASKVYVRWHRRGVPAETDIYDASSLRWLGNTRAFLPDERAAGFESHPPFLWTLDPAGRALRVDTNNDRVERVYDPHRWFGPGLRGVADAWGDLLLVRIDVGHDRYRVVDVVSGEIGPALDLEGYRQAQPRLALRGRALVLLGMTRRPVRYRRWPSAVATGSGVVYDLWDGAVLDEFRLVVPRDLPVAALGATRDPVLAGRLWIHSPIDELRLDFDIPACDRHSPAQAPRAEIVAHWDPTEDPTRYGYRLQVDPASDEGVGAIAVRAGRMTDRTGKPDGWGVDLIEGDRWVRWANGLGPAHEDVAPGEALDGFVLAARAGARPGIGEYRIQTAHQPPRGCGSEEGFLETGRQGHTVVPEQADGGDVGALTERLEGLVERACDIEWIARQDCPELQSIARVLAAGPVVDRVDEFQLALSASTVSSAASVVLHDALRSVRDALDE